MNRQKDTREAPQPEDPIRPSPPGSHLSYPTTITPHVITFFEPMVDDILVDTTREKIEEAIKDLQSILDGGCVGYDKIPLPIFVDNSREDRTRSVSVRWAYQSSPTTITEEEENG